MEFEFNSSLTGDNILRSSLSIVEGGAEIT